MGPFKLRLGLIARADNSGLGVQSWEYYRHLQPERVLVIDVGHLHNDTTHTNKRTFLDRYPNPMVCKGWVPDRQQLKSFMAGLDVVLAAECFYSSHVVDVAHRYKVRTVLVPNWEFYDRRVRADLLAAPSMWHYDEYPDPKTFLPVPIATDRFTTEVRAGDKLHFLHIVGRPAHADRNGTADLLQALAYVRSDVVVTIKCQQPGYVSELIRKHRVRTPGNVQLRVDSSDVQNYWDNYTQGDVLVMPRRFGGLCLPVNEALGAGMPVIMPAISPNPAWLPSEWLVPAVRQGSFVAKQRVDVYGTHPEDLAATMDAFASDPDLYAKARDEALRLRGELSWSALKPRYEEVLRG